MIEIKDAVNAARKDFFYNTKNIGYVYIETDGYYTFVFKGNFGCWDANQLRNIADALDKLNEPWNLQLKDIISKGNSGEIDNDPGFSEF